MAHEIFVSYSSKDKPIADGICANLESAGLRCWIAPRDIMPGEDFPSAIASAIADSKVFVLVFSQNANMSDDVSNELYLAFNNKIIIVPFKIEDVQPVPGKAYYLGRTHWLDAMTPPTLEQIDNLVQVINSYLKIRTESSKQKDKDLSSLREIPATPRAVQNQNRNLWITASIVLLSLLGLGIYYLLKSGSIPATSGLVATAESTALPQIASTPQTGSVTEAVNTILDQLPPTIQSPALSSGTVQFTTDENSPFLFLDDFNDPEYDGMLPANMLDSEIRCDGIKIFQKTGALTFQTPKNFRPWCVLDFMDSGDYFLSDIKAVEFSLSSSEGTETHHPSFGPIFGGSKSNFDNPSGEFLIICNIGPNNCQVKEGSNTIFQSKSFLEKPGDSYTFKIEVLDPADMKFRFTVNDQELGEYTVPAEKAQIYQGIVFHLSMGEADSNFTKVESEMHLENVAVIKR